MRKTRWFIGLLLTAVALFALSAFAQVTNGFEITAADEKVKAVLSKYSAFKFLLVPVTGILVMAIKKWLAFIPTKILPWTAPIIGALLDYLGAKFGFWTGSLEAGAAMGGLATWAHQALVVQPKADANKPAAG